MDKVQAITRRFILAGLPLAAAAASLPALASCRSLLLSPIPAMVDAHEAARLALAAANAATETVFADYLAENEADPIMVELPGFRFGHFRRRATKTSSHAIREFYADHYGMLSGKSGLTLKADGSWLNRDFAAEQERDLAQALVNYEAAVGKLKERARRVGLTAAEERMSVACDTLEAAWAALLTYVPLNLPELRQKAAAVLAIVTADPVQLDEDHSEMLLRSLVGEA